MNRRTISGEEERGGREGGGRQEKRKVDEEKGEGWSIGKKITWKRRRKWKGIKRWKGTKRNIDNRETRKRWEILVTKKREREED